MKIRHVYGWSLCQHLERLIGLVNQHLFIDLYCSSPAILRINIPNQK